MWPTIQIDPIADALHELQSFYRLHQKRATVLACSPESYRSLISVGAGLLKQLEDGWEIDGARIVYDRSVTGYNAR